MCLTRFSFDGTTVRRESNMNHRHQGGAMVSVPNRGLMIIGKLYFVGLHQPKFQALHQKSPRLKF